MKVLHDEVSFASTALAILTEDFLREQSFASMNNLKKYHKLRLRSMPFTCGQSDNSFHT